MGSVADVAISALETERLLARDPAAAEARAREFLAQRPHSSGALLLLGSALRRQGNFAAAKDVLEPLAKLQPDLVLAQFELGLTLGGLGEHEDALRVLLHAVDLVPHFAQAWYALAEQLDGLKRPDHTDPDLRRARDAIGNGELSSAESLLRRRMSHAPDEAASFLLSLVLLAQERGHEALPLIDGLIAENADNRPYRDLRAAALFQIEDFQAAIEEYEHILNDSPERAGAWMSYGRALRALGRTEECIAAFRRAIGLLPGWVEAYRTLASVKGYRFGQDDIAALRALLACPDLQATSYAELHFAMGRALEEGGQYAEAFNHYEKSAALQRANISYSAEAATRFARRETAVFTPAFIRERQGWGCQSPGPIFVVGMPRAGSTLVQEILCAHLAIERTGELRDLTWMVSRLDTESAATGAYRYPEVLRDFERARFAALGEEYLQRTLPRRKLGRPFFVDKYPGNFIRTGLIHLILPNARIVDVRRHPLDCCLSCFKQYFPEGPLFSHNLSELGRYYADYVEVMAHFDRVLPGKVHRVIYEELVHHPEREVRRLLQYLNLPFEEQCLRYYETAQAVMTTSAEQVRVPIHERALGSWRRYQDWLGPLKSALGPVLDAYPAAPNLYSPMPLSLTVRLA